MGDEDEIVTLMVARSTMEAQVVRSVLEGAGIPVHVPGAELRDEWGASQQALGRLGTEVRVPRERLEEARRVLEAARSAGEGDEGGPREAPGG